METKDFLCFYQKCVKDYDDWLDYLRKFNDNERPEPLGMYMLTNSFVKMMVDLSEKFNDVIYYILELKASKNQKAEFCYKTIKKILRLLESFQNTVISKEYFFNKVEYDYFIYLLNREHQYWSNYYNDGIDQRMFFHHLDIIDVTNKDKKGLCGIYIYYTLEPQFKVAYVGKTEDLGSRIISHHRRKEFNVINSFTPLSLGFIAYPCDQLSEAESMWIEIMKPTRNNQPRICI